MTRCVLKSDRCCAVLDGKTEVSGDGKAGVYLRDTRYLSDYRWDLGPLAMLAEAEGADWAFRHWGLFDDRAQRVSIAREFRLFPQGL